MTSDGDIDKVIKENAKLHLEIRQLNADIKEYGTRIDAVKAENTKLKSDIDDVKAFNAQLQANINGKDKEIWKLQTEKMLLQPDRVERRIQHAIEASIEKRDEQWEDAVKHAFPNGSWYQEEIVKKMRHTEIGYWS
jgi:chromosome segregation ATPase